MMLRRFVRTGRAAAAASLPAVAATIDESVAIVETHARCHGSNSRRHRSRHDSRDTQPNDRNRRQGKSPSKDSQRQGQNQPVPRSNDWAKALEETASKPCPQINGKGQATPQSTSSTQDGTSQPGAATANIAGGFPALVSICRSWRYTIQAYNSGHPDDLKKFGNKHYPLKSLPPQDQIDSEIAELENVLQTHYKAIAEHKNSNTGGTAAEQQQNVALPSEILSSKDTHRKEGQLALAKLRAAVLLDKPLKTIGKPLVWVRDNCRRLSEEDTAMVFHDLHCLMPRVNEPPTSSPDRNLEMSASDRNLYWAVFNTLLGQFEASDRLSPISRLAVLYRCGHDGSAPSKRHLNLFAHEAQEGILLVEMSKESDPQRCAAILFMATSLIIRAPNALEIDRGVRQIEEALARRFPHVADVPRVDEVSKASIDSRDSGELVLHLNGHDVLNASKLLSSSKFETSIIRKLFISRRILMELVNTAAHDAVPYPDQNRLKELSSAEATTALENIMVSRSQNPRHIALLDEVVVSKAQHIRAVTFQLKVVSFCNNGHGTTDPEFESAVVDRLLTMGNLKKRDAQYVVESQTTESEAEIAAALKEESGGVDAMTILSQMQKNKALPELIAVYGKRAIAICSRAEDMNRLCQLLSLATYVGLENQKLRMEIVKCEVCYATFGDCSKLNECKDSELPAEIPSKTFASKAIPAALEFLEQRLPSANIPKLKQYDLVWTLLVLSYCYRQLQKPVDASLSPLLTKEASEAVHRTITALTNLLVSEVIARMPKPSLMVTRLSSTLNLPIKDSLRDDYVSFMVSSMSKNMSLQVFRDLLPALRMESSNIVSIARIVGIVNRVSTTPLTGQMFYHTPEDGPRLLKLVQKLVRVYASQSSSEPGLEAAVLYKFTKLYFDSFADASRAFAHKDPPELGERPELFYAFQGLIPSNTTIIPSWCVEEALAMCLQSRANIPAIANKFLAYTVKRSFAYSFEEFQASVAAEGSEPMIDPGLPTDLVGEDFAQYLLSQFPQSAHMRLTSHFVSALKAGIITYEDLSPRNISIIVNSTLPNGLPLLLLAFEAARADTSLVLKRVKECPPAIRALVLRVWGAAPARSISTQGPQSLSSQPVVIAAVTDSQTTDLLNDVAQGVDKEGAVQILKNRAIVNALPDIVIATLWDRTEGELLTAGVTADADPIQPETLLSIAIKAPHSSSQITVTLRDRSVSFVSLLFGLSQKVPIAFIDEALAQLVFIPPAAEPSGLDEAKIEESGTEKEKTVSQPEAVAEGLEIKKPLTAESPIGFSKESMATFTNAVRFSHYLSKVFFASTVSLTNAKNPNYKGTNPKARHHNRASSTAQSQFYIPVADELYDRLRSLLRTATNIKNRIDNKSIATGDVDKLLSVCGQLHLILHTRAKMANEEIKSCKDRIRQVKVKIRLEGRKELQTQMLNGQKAMQEEEDNDNNSAEVSTTQTFEEQIARLENLIGVAKDDLEEISDTVATIRSILPSLVKINTDTPSQLEKALASIPPPLRPLAIEEAIGDAVLLKFDFVDPLKGVDLTTNAAKSEALSTEDADEEAEIDVKKPKPIKFTTLFSYIQVLEKYQVYYLPFQEAITKYASDAMDCFESVEGIRAADGTLPPQVVDAIKDCGIVSSRQIIEPKAAVAAKPEQPAAADGEGVDGDSSSTGVSLTEDLTAPAPAPIVVAPSGTPVDNGISLLKHSLKGGNVADKTIVDLTTRLVAVSQSSVSRVDHLMRILQCYAESPVNLPQHQLVVQALLNVEDAESEVAATDFARVVSTMSRMKSLHLHRSSINNLLEGIYSAADSHSQTVIMKALSHDEEIMRENVTTILGSASQNIDYYTGDDIENVATALIQLSSYVEYSVIEEFVEQLCSRVLSLINTAKKSTLVRMLHLLTHFKLQDVVVVEAIYKSLEEKMPRLDVNQLLTILRSMVELEMPPREVLILLVVKRIETFVEGMSPAGVVQSLGLMVDLNVAFLPATNALFLRANDFKEQIRQQKSLQQVMERASEEYIIEAPPYVTRHFLKKQKERMRLQALLEIHMERKALMKLEAEKLIGEAPTTEGCEVEQEVDATA